MPVVGRRHQCAVGHNGAVAHLSGQIIVATPQIGGDIFNRSVVLLLHHDDEGAHGLVLNKPLGAPIERVLPGWEKHASAPQELFQGGPVGLDTALGLVRVPGMGDQLGIRVLFGSLGVVDLDAPPELVMPEVSDLRVFAGYSGWSAGQLENEIAEGSWYVCEATPQDAFTAVPDGLWSGVLRRQRGELAWVASYPEDPHLN